MQVKVTPSVIAGTVTAPASKSAMQRACALALLHDGLTVISNPGKSNDDQAALSIIQSLGATVENVAGKLHVHGSKLFNGKTSQLSGEPVTTFNCGESGLSIRMFTPVAALSRAAINVTGHGSLLSRPMDFFDDILPKLGVRIASNQGKLPLQITGPLKPASITVDGSLSSQFLTGLLIAFAKAANEPVAIEVTNLKSKPYIDLTMQLMKHFGYAVEHEQYERFLIEPSKNGREIIHYSVEGDWSGAAFLLVAGAIAGSVTVKGLDVSSSQADRAVLQVLMMSNAILSISDDNIVVSTAVLQPFQFDATDCPDLFPPLVALAAYCNGTSVITGVSRLAHKESDRALTLQQEFGKMGLVIKLQDDLMIIEGGKGLNGASVHSHHDHRIAMALAVAAIKANGNTNIAEANAIDKSYPDFYLHLAQLGAQVHL